MYLITNRQLKATAGRAEIFESFPNAKGANELRVVKITGAGSRIQANVLPDRLPAQRVKALKKEHDLDIDESQPWYVSLEVACDLFATARKKNCHILFYVHGYNNDVKDIIRTARTIERQYSNVIVVPFSWPAKGGGAVSGTANYINDKRDARASEGALDRLFEAIRKYHALLVECQSKALWTRAKKKHGENLEAVRAEFVKLQSRVCKVSINLLCHSMGNYVLKHAAIPLAAQIRKIVFDNVCLVAADTNVLDHFSWVETIEHRSALYVVINEEDHALQWSRRKPGHEQLERLGHSLNGLVAKNTTYIDVTKAPHVRDSHSYYWGDAPKNNTKLQTMFDLMFTGDRPERSASLMRFFPDLNAYRPK